MFNQNNFKLTFLAVIASVLGILLIQQQVMAAWEPPVEGPPEGNAIIVTNPLTGHLYLADFKIGDNTSFEEDGVNDFVLDPGGPTGMIIRAQNTGIYIETDEGTSIISQGDTGIWAQSSCYEHNNCYGIFSEALGEATAIKGLSYDQAIGVEGYAAGNNGTAVLGKAVGENSKGIVGKDEGTGSWAGYFNGPTGKVYIKELCLGTEGNCASDWDGSSSPPGNWTLHANGNDIFNNNSGYVGIGTTDPTSILHIYKDDGTGVDNAEIKLQSVVGDNNHWGIYHDRSNDNLTFWRADDLFTFAKEGNLGIGVDNPDNKLVIKSDAPNTNIIRVLGSDGDSIIDIAETSGGHGFIEVMDADFNDTIRLHGNGNSFINNAGNVGIGTDAPSYKLEVAGTVFAEDVLIANQDLVVVGNSMLLGDIRPMGIVCSENQIIKRNSDATWRCADDEGGSGVGDDWGDQAVVSENSLAGDGTTLSPLAVDIDECTGESSIKKINTDGTVVCETDDGGSGTGDDWGLQVVESLGSLTGTGILGDELGVVGWDCANPDEYITTINPDGTFVCETDYFESSVFWQAGTDSSIHSTNAGNVGIGLEDPNSKLHVYDNTQNAEIDIQTGGLNHWGIYQDGDSDLNFWNFNSDNLLTLSDNGNVGISDTDPDYELDVNGTISARDNFIFHDEIMPDGVTCGVGQILKRFGADDWQCAEDIGTTGGDGYIGQNDVGVHNAGNDLNMLGYTLTVEKLSPSGYTCTDGQVLKFNLNGDLVCGNDEGGTGFWEVATGGINYSGGNVGIGITTPIAELHVSGSIIAEDDLTFHDEIKPDGLYCTEDQILKRDGGAPGAGTWRCANDEGGEGIGDDWGDDVVVSEDSLSGDGTASSPLGVSIYECTGESSIKKIYVDGTVDCETDDSGGTGFWQAGTENNEIYYNDDNVGIGTANPNKRLHVYDDTYNAEIDIESDNNSHWGIYQQTYNEGNQEAGDLRFWHTNAGNLLTLTDDSDGRVGIRTIDPGYALDVVGFANADWLCIDEDCRNVWPGSDVADGYIGQNQEHTAGGQLNMDANILIVEKLNPSGDVLGGDTCVNDEVLKFNLNGDLVCGTDNDDGLWSTNSYGIFYTDGNVGIGTTSNNNYKLDIDGDLHTSDYIRSESYISAGTDIDAEDDVIAGGSLYFTDEIIPADSEDCEVGQILKRFGDDDWRCADESGGGLWTLHGNGLDIYRHSETEEYKVGIGTTDPAKKLEVSGEAQPLRLSFGGKYTDIGPNNSTWSWFDTTATGGFYFADAVVVDGGKISSFNEDLELRADFDAAASDNQLYLKTDGNVGIGTDSPNKKFHVYDDTNNAEIDIQTAGLNHWGIYHASESDGLRFWHDDSDGYSNVVEFTDNGIIIEEGPQIYRYGDALVIDINTN